MADDPVPRAIVRGDLPAYTATPSPPPPDAIVIPTYRLYSAGQMALATFFGSPLAGCWLLGRNFNRLGRTTAARLSVVLGLVWLLALFGIALWVPFMNFAPFVSIGLIVAVAHHVQGTDLLHHARLGGRRGSWGITVATGVISLVIVMAGVFGGAVAYYIATEAPRVHFADSEVIYEGGGTEAEAQAVGTLLREQEYFSATSDRPAATVIVGRNGKRALVSFYVQESAFDEPQTRASFADFAEALSTRAFAGQPVDLWLIDQEQKPRVRLPWEDRPQRVAFDKDEVWYRNGSNITEAKAVGLVLTEQGYFSDAGYSVAVRRHGRVVVTFTVNSEVNEKPDVKVSFHRYAYRLSKGAFSGAAVDVELSDGTAVLARLAWEDRPDDPIDLGDGREIVYTDGGTLDEARAVAAVLKDVTQKHMWVTRDGEGRAAVAFTHTTTVDERLHAYADELSTKAFAGKPVDLWFIDADDKPLATLVWEKRPKPKKR